MVGAGLGDSGEQREQETMLPLKKTGIKVRAQGSLGVRGQFYNQEEMEEMEHREEALPAPTLVTIGILTNRMRMGQGLPLCTNTPL